MATKRLPMRKIRDALRLEARDLSRRQIAASLNIGRTAARTYTVSSSMASLCASIRKCQMPAPRLDRNRGK